MDVAAIAIHSAFDAVEADFHRALETSLDPRGPDVLFDLVAALELPAGAKAVDVGCGRGEQALELAERFGLDVLGIDPVARYERAAAHQLSNGSTTFRSGTGESIPVESSSLDLVSCRESLMYTDLDAAAAEFARVLRPGGGGLIYLVLTGPLMDDREAEEFNARGRSRNLRPADIEHAMVAAGLAIDERVDLQGEWGERRQELDGDPGRRLLYAARLLRQPDRYVAEFGRDNYEIMLGDCLWHVYRLIGKLAGYVCIFTKP